MSSVTVYVKENCVMCEMTKTVLTQQGIPFEKKFITPEFSKELRSLGVSQAPYVVAGDQTWSGFRPDKIIGLKEMAAAA